jgi:hypothetical protein
MYSIMLFSSGLSSTKSLFCEETARWALSNESFYLCIENTRNAPDLLCRRERVLNILYPMMLQQDP